MASFIHRKVLFFTLFILIPISSFSEVDLTMGAIVECPPNTNRVFDPCLLDQWAMRVKEGIQREIENERLAMEHSARLEYANSRVMAANPNATRKQLNPEAADRIERVQGRYRERNQCFGSDISERLTTGLSLKCNPDAIKFPCEDARNTAVESHREIERRVQGAFRMERGPGAIETGIRIQTHLKNAIQLMRGNTNTCLNALMEQSTGQCRTVYEDVFNNQEIFELYVKHCEPGNVDTEVAQFKIIMGYYANTFNKASRDYVAAMDLKAQSATQLEQLSAYLEEVQRAIDGRAPANTEPGE